MTPSFVFVIYLLIYAANSMGWSNIWSDDCETKGDWVCPSGDEKQGDHCKFGDWSSDGGRCQDGNCYELCHKNYIERSTTISNYAYAGRYLHLSLDVRKETDCVDCDPSDRCRIWFAYDGDNFNIYEPDWECGSQATPCAGQVT
eukprot:203518_1